MFKNRFSEFALLTAIRHEGEAWSYSRLLEEMEKISNSLPNVKCLALDLASGPRLVTLLLASVEERIPFLVLNPLWNEDRKEAFIRMAGASHRATADSIREIEGVQHSPGRGVAYYALSSGSTGEPKCAPIAGESLARLMKEQSEAFGLAPGLRVLQFANPGYDALIAEVFTSLWAGCELSFTGAHSAQAVENTRRKIEAGGIDMVTLTPSVARIVGPKSLSKLKILALAGEEADPQLVESLLGSVRIFNAYGPCETTCCTHIFPILDPNSVNCIGEPLPSVHVRLLKSDGLPAETGERGELHIYGPQVGLGYVHEPNSDRFFNDAERGPAYRTGDLFENLGDGRLRFAGRVDSEIKIRGQKVVLSLLERTAEELAGVEKAIALAARLESDVEIALFIVGQAAKEELAQFLGTRLPAVYQPGSITILDRIPLTANGKLDRESLKQKLEVQMPAPGTSDENQARTLWARILSRPPQSQTEDFFAAGGDSLAVVELSVAFEQALGRSFALAEFLENPNFSRFERFVQTNSPRQGEPDLNSLLTEISTWNSPRATTPKGPVLLTGATGQVGRHVLNRLLALGQEVIALGRDLKGRLSASGVRCIEGDLNQDLTAAIEDLPQLGAVIHCGAMVNHILPYEALFNANVRSTFQLLALAYRQNCRLIYVSSTSSGEGAGRTGYDRSKWSAERLVVQARERGIEASVARLPLILDDQLKTWGDHFTARLRHCLEAGQAPDSRDPVVALRARDAAEVLARMVASPRLEPAYDFLQDDGQEWTEIVSALGPLELKDFGSWKKTLSRPASPLEKFQALYQEGGAYAQRFLPLVDRDDDAISQFRRFLSEHGLNPTSSAQVLSRLNQEIRL